MALPAAALDSIHSAPKSNWHPLDSEVTARVTLAADGKTLAFDRLPLMYASCAYFMSQLKDETGQPLVVEAHHEEWCALMQYEPLVVLLAPRDHGKTYTSLSYLLWRAWRHNRDPRTGRIIDGLPEGKFEVVWFSKIKDQAESFFETFQSIMLANEELFADILPDSKRIRGRVRGVWSRTRVRLNNRFEISIRAYRTSTRGLHPDMLLLDDVLDESNSLTAYQRNKTWNYFFGVLMPMNARQVIVIGTALHYDDLLHRLKPRPGKQMKFRIRGRKVQLRWVKFRAANWEQKITLWPTRHPIEELEGLRDADPVLFAREYQNDPFDDASSLFPYSLTSKALKRGEHMRLLPLMPGSFRPAAEEVVIGGMDIATSESVGADYTVLMLVALNRRTMERRLIFAHRERGMGFDQQIALLRTACGVFAPALVIVEQNGFQRWLRRETVKYPETTGRVLGHNTGTEKRDLTDGVPSLKITMQDELWTVPSGDDDPKAKEFAQVWQAEFNAFGWKDDKLQGVGEHDDVVMATWFVDLGVRLVEEWQRQGPAEQVVGPAEVGMDDPTVTIGQDF